MMIISLLTAIFTIFAVGGLNRRLNKVLHFKELESTPKWKNAINGERFITTDLPKLAPVEIESDIGRAFYHDFKLAMNFLNEEFQDTPWSFQDRQKNKVSISFEDECDGREIEIRYGQQITGWVKIASIKYGDPSFRNILDVNLINSRFFEGEQIFRLLRGLGLLVLDSFNSDEEREMKFGILQSMIHASWEIGEDAFGNPDLTFHARGMSKIFLASTKHNNKASRK